MYTKMGLLAVLTFGAMALMIPLVSLALGVEEGVTVVGTRTERSLDEVSATISVISSEDIERELARDISDLVRFEPGVVVSGTGSRFGLGGFNIRGIEGNRVLTLVDGVRVADEFSFGPFLSSRRDYVDVDSLSRAEIARGPISSLYGSDALGGVVAFTTKSPGDYLHGEGAHIGAKFGYSSLDSSAVATITGAAGNDKIAGLLLFTQRQGDETETAGSNGGFGATRTEADPQSIDSLNLVGKLEVAITDTQRITIGIDRYDNETDTSVYSDYGTLSRGTLVNTRDAEDQRERLRYSLTYSFDGETIFSDDLKITLYRQESETDQLTLESRTTRTKANESRTRRSIFEQEIQGVVLQVGKAFDFGPGNHFLTFGVDHYETQNESLRDGGTVDADGAPVFEFSPLPTRDFPITEISQTAFFLQDEISFLGGRLLLSPGLRYDEFEADTKADAIYRAGNPGVSPPVDFEDSEVTGKFGVVYRFSDVVSVFAQYSEGFRAPPYDDVNVGFTNFIGGYKTISNPNLESETSEGLEAGIRFQGGFGFVSVNLFKNDYENFIESLTIAPQFGRSFGIDPSDGLLTFQSVNLSEVEIKGAEFSAELLLDEVLGTLPGLKFRAAIAYANGEDDTSSEPINTVEPLTAVLGFGYDAPSKIWGADLVWTLVEAKDGSDIDATSSRVETAGYGIVDLITYYRFTEKITVNAGIFNLTDKKYIRWADTVSIGSDALGRFSQSGLNGSATIRIAL
jgi:hemoglobin/transferrin/lactoferrin receptor protein